MSPARVEEVYLDFTKALSRLSEAVNEDLKKGSIVVDGLIQRFEFTFELAWKLTKRVLSYNGIEAETPRLIIKEAFKAGILKDGEGWIDMLEDRNQTAHVYDDATGMKIFNKIKKYHFKLLEDFKKDVTSFFPKG